MLHWQMSTRGVCVCPAKAQEANPPYSCPGRIVGHAHSNASINCETLSRLNRFHMRARISDILMHLRCDLPSVVLSVNCGP